MIQDWTGCIDISLDDPASSADQWRTLHEIMGSNQSVWTSNIEDIEMATFKWILGHFSCSRKLMDWKQQENSENVFFSPTKKREW